MLTVKHNVYIFFKFFIKISDTDMKYTFLVFTLVFLCFQHGKTIIIYKAICKKFNILLILIVLQRFN